MNIYRYRRKINMVCCYYYYQAIILSVFSKNKQDVIYVLNHPDEYHNLYDNEPYYFNCIAYFLAKRLNYKYIADVFDFDTNEDDSNMYNDFDMSMVTRTLLEYRKYDLIDKYGKVIIKNAMEIPTFISGMDGVLYMLDYINNNKLTPKAYSILMISALMYRMRDTIAEIANILNEKGGFEPGLWISSWHDKEMINIIYDNAPKYKDMMNRIEK